MNRDPLIMVCCSDIAGQVRGKGFPAHEREPRLRQGVGWTPTNVMINCFGTIVATPFGPFGDLMLIPDPTSEVFVDFGDSLPAEHFFIGDIVETDGRTPWDLCLRTFLRRALDDLEREAGLRLTAAVEHEFFYTGAQERLGDSYSMDAMRLHGGFLEAYLYALRVAGVEPDTVLPEYGPRQYEVTCKPALGVEAADRALKVRELARATAYRHGHRVSFSPVVTRGIVGNGVHVHFSLSDTDGRPVGHDPSGPCGVGPIAGQFLAGIQRHLPALCAVTAPSVLSYERLVPHRWSAAYSNLGYRDREAGIRICPVWELPGTDTAAQFHFEYRAADAAASPYLMLGALVRAGLQGLREELPSPEPTTADPEAMSRRELARRGIVRLPRSLAAALDALEDDKVACGWFPPALLNAYLMHKRGEIGVLAGLSADEIADRYARAY